MATGKVVVIHGTKLPHKSSNIKWVKKGFAFCAGHH